MLNYYYKDTIKSFLSKTTEQIIGEITIADKFDSSLFQKTSWNEQIHILKRELSGLDGTIYFEFSIPRMGKRVDTVLIIGNLVFVIEFKVGERNFHSHDIDQVWDYALDLKNFHEPSHSALLIPVLVSTNAQNSFITISTTHHNDNLVNPLCVNMNSIRTGIDASIDFYKNNSYLQIFDFDMGRYSPTPTIIEAAMSLYSNHTVEDITRRDASAKNLSITSEAITDIIEIAKSKKKKIICFVTGVPGAGKTLVGLKVATKHLDKQNGNASVYLSGNGPLVKILHEALARDKVRIEKARGNPVRKSEIKESVKAFIQNIHHYRDEYLRDSNPPYDHVAIFDEAQRAWNKDKTVQFMRQRKGQPNFKYSEPEYLISCLDRHQDWAVVVCLVGGGQEIHTGEAGISEWLRAIGSLFNDWEVFISPNLQDSEYSAKEEIKLLHDKCKVHFNQDLHLAVSLRSFRAEHLSRFVKQLLDINIDEAQATLAKIIKKYPIALTRDLSIAKKWLNENARGTERYGMVVSSQAQRLKPYAIDIKSPIDPVHWFLNGKEDIRSSYFLEDVVTEFQIQGLELDWACVVWDGDLRYSENGWKTFSFKGDKWQRILKEDRIRYLINAYRVLLTRARQGFIVVVPEGANEDHTRLPEFYDSTFNYLKEMGIPVK